MKHCYDELRTYRPIMFRCFVVASPQSLWFLNLKAALFCRPIPRKMLCRQMITFMQILNGQMSAAYCVADCSSLPAVVCAPPAVVGNSSTSWDTQRSLDRTATLCDRELVFVTVCASTGGHQRQYGRKFGDRSRRSILVSTSIKQTWLVVVPLPFCYLFLI